ncbi:hypothetical protein [Leucothrix arctica]|uniref:Peptidase M28 domain-containing protein n=1 Tax=Leucothrix arctica TaxID=1481894 RepID=A0A317CKH9_9GAMM|nr:hypothetical protein [Leucothrix arctica]PWQ99006.1 hypothetical protein DKT75_02285 [Leucothrix arctica]
MLDRMIARLLDWLIATLIVCLLLWFFITQPLLPTAVSNDLPEVSETNLRNHLTNLKNIESTREVSKSTSLTADDYIFNYFSRLGEPSLQGFATATGRYNNVRLRLGPKTKERIVIGVRYLVLPGAIKRQSNNSGLAVMLETARLFSKEVGELPMSVEFVAYGDSNADTAGAGSFHHAKALSNAKIPVRVMLELQSVGYYRKVSDSQSYPFSFMAVLYPDKGNFIALSSRLNDFMKLRSVKHSFSSVPDLLVESFSTPENISVVSGVDHINYWLNDYSAIQIGDLLPLRVEGGENELVMDYERMSQVVKALYQVAVSQEVATDNKNEGYFSGVVAGISGFFGG